VKSSSVVPSLDEIALFIMPQSKPSASRVGNWALIAKNMAHPTAICLGTLFVS
jgi:hypothetical protein